MIRTETTLAGSRHTSVALTSLSKLACREKSSLCTDATRLAKKDSRALAPLALKSVEVITTPTQISALVPRTKVVRAPTSILTATSRLELATSALARKATELLPPNALDNAQREPLMLVGWVAASRLITELPASPSAPIPKSSHPQALAAMNRAPVVLKVSAHSALARAQPAQPAASAFFVCQRVTSAPMFGPTYPRECKESLMPVCLRTGARVCCKWAPSLEATTLSLALPGEGQIRQFELLACYKYLFMKLFVS